MEGMSIKYKTWTDNMLKKEIKTNIDNEPFAWQSEFDSIREEEKLKGMCVYYIKIAYKIYNLLIIALSQINANFSVLFKRNK